MSTEFPRQDVVLACWRQGLKTPIAEMEARVAEYRAMLRRKDIPYTIVAGHLWDAATMQRLNEAFARLLAESG